MPQTYKPTELSQFVIDLLNTNKAALGLFDVIYGDENFVGKTPTAAVWTEDVRRDMYSTGYRTENTIQLVIKVYYSEFGDSELSTKACEQLVEAIIPIVEADTTFGGNVAHAFVARIQPTGRDPSRGLKVGIVTIHCISVTAM